MKSFPRRRELEEIIDSVVRLLDESLLRHEIDEPIDAAASSFEFSNMVEASAENAVFLQTIGAFVAHIYQHGIRAPRTLTWEQAQAEAVFLLEQAYKGTSTNGYDGALRDTAKSGVQGLCEILMVLADTLKAIRRQWYERWVVSTHIEHLDWEVRRDVTAIVLERWGQLMGKDVEGWSPEELTPACAWLIKAHVGSNDGLR